MMNDFLTTVLNSPVIATVVETILLCGFVLWLQHIYNKKLEQHKEQVQKKIDEHQIQFKYWHEEKAKAIKMLYVSLIELYYTYVKFAFEDRVVLKNSDILKMGSIARDKAFSLHREANKCFMEWKKLQIYLEDDEDALIGKFFSNGSNFETLCLDLHVYKDFDSFEKGLSIGLNELSAIMELLRTHFRNTLLLSKDEKQKPIPKIEKNG